MTYQLFNLALHLSLPFGFLAPLEGDQFGFPAPSEVDAIKAVHELGGSLKYSPITFRVVGVDLSCAHAKDDIVASLQAFSHLAYLSGNLTQKIEHYIGTIATMPAVLPICSATGTAIYLKNLDPRFV